MTQAQAINPASAYRALVSSGAIVEDAAQASVVQCLQSLHEELGSLTKKSLFARRGQAPLRGLYIWGNVGRGKSMLMDMFFSAAPVGHKRRAHFHAFMQEVHARLHDIRRTSQKKGGDPVAQLAAQIAKETRLLCFDELQAADVADASLLQRLFEGLLDAGVLIVSTSNHPPESLYTGGVQKERFDKFIALIKTRMNVCPLSSPRDYRTEQIRALSRVYFTPLGRAADHFIVDILHVLAPGGAPNQMQLPVQGRTLTLACYTGGIALTGFAELCETALGPADYLAIAQAVKTLILTGIPIMPPEKRNEAKRFSTLIDALYESKVKLICTADAKPEELYPQGNGSFEFQRTTSRLIEMQSEKYLRG